MVKQTIVYESLDQDLVQAHDPNYELSKEYRWIHSSRMYSAGSFLLYPLFQGFAFFYLRMRHHLSIQHEPAAFCQKNQGLYLYINHTQPMADPFLASQLLHGKRGYVLCRQDNLSIPILGRLLPLLGAMPIPDTKRQMEELKKAIALRIRQKQAVIIFPEGHVWPYASFLRPFSLSSFTFPLYACAPCYCASVCYKMRKKGSRPAMQVYIDGPFYPDSSLKIPAARKKLKEQIAQVMEKRIRENSEEYIRYVKKEVL